MVITECGKKSRKQSGSVKETHSNKITFAQKAIDTCICHLQV